MIENITITNSNSLFKSIRMFQKEKQDFCVFFFSGWDKQSKFVLYELKKAGIDQSVPILLVDTFETPELFSTNERIFSCVTVPACYFYRYDKRIREYRIFKEILPSRILEGLGVFE